MSTHASAGQLLAVAYAPASGKPVIMWTVCASHYIRLHHFRWRFACVSQFSWPSCPHTPFVRVIEMQAMLIELVDNFEFSPPPGNVEIIRAAAGIMSPMSAFIWLLCTAHIRIGSCRIKGSSSGQVQLPLTITPVMQHEE